MTLEDILNPVTLDEFRQERYGKAYLRIPGTTDRFARLVSFRELNEVISRIRVGVGRISIVRNGKKIDPDEYLVDVSGGHGKRVNTLALERRLRLGDSLVLNAAHELFPELQEVVDSIETACRVFVGANLYAGFKQWRGFDLHFDPHDTLIVQIHGRKFWQVYEPTISHPLNRPQDMVKPTKGPVWEGLLKSGDVLYMPHGWWHVAEPVDGPSVHVTFSMPQPIGIDLLTWILDDLKEKVVSRQPLPVFGATEERASYVAQLAEALACELTGDAVERFFNWREYRASSRRTLTLPMGADDVAAVDATTPLVLVESRRLVFLRLNERELGFWAARRFWRCDATLRHALGAFDDREGHSVDDLDARVPAELKSFFRIFVRALTEAGGLVPARVRSPEEHVSDFIETVPSKS